MSSLRFMCTNTDEMKEMAARICRDYLHGAWKNITAEEIGFKRISGGLSNWLYHVWLPENKLKDQNQNISSSPPEQSLNEDEPNQVLLRVYGQVHGERALEHLITESVIFTLLSERRMGPRLHGIFPGGRIEQYINARPLTTTELSIPSISRQIANKMGIIHSMDIPISKEPQWIWKTAERWINTVETCVVKDQKCRTQYNEQILKIKNYDLKNELIWLQQYVNNLKSPVVFCHNDMQEGNILIQQQNACTDETVTSSIGDNDQLILIDYEYCSYNYRGFDMANHFLEWTYEYTNPEYPFFYELPNNYPTKEQQLNFIQEYIKVTGTTSEPSEILTEIRVFSLASHFFWGLWGCANAPLSQIPFGYWDYAESRLDAYFKLKDDLTSSQVIATKRNLHDTD
ncbi:choline/ethanolamine kinase isoform X1 [Chrysoperla carnea]|uniref:choline/ethanolamine kinase isoform X1 n=1 Tax=Chrysoperla carnea TaxID=189513 RepID=UPI001D08DBE5|nr:choline/ethanolamine kinase isoform X1 [Chrysoperla carnea]